MYKEILNIDKKSNLQIFHLNNKIFNIHHGFVLLIPIDASFYDATIHNTNLNSYFLVRYRKINKTWDNYRGDYGTSLKEILKKEVKHHIYDNSTNPIIPAILLTKIDEIDKNEVMKIINDHVKW